MYEKVKLMNLMKGGEGVDFLTAQGPELVILEMTAT
jgi:hypothetical protein